MKTRQTIVFFGTLVIIGVLALTLYQQRQNRWQQAAGSMGEKVLPTLDVNAVTSLTLTAPGAELTLEKQSERWGVAQRYGYAADFGKLRDLLIKLDELTIVQPVAAGPAQYARLRLLAPDEDSGGGGGDAGTRLVLADGASKHTLLMGKEHMRKSEMGGEWPDGRYLLLPDRSPAAVVLVSETFSSVKAAATAWLDKEFIKISDVQEATLTREGTQQWRLTAKPEGDGLMLADLAEDEAVAADKLSGIDTAFSWIQFADVADPGVELATHGLDNPAVFRAVDADHLAYTVSIGTVNAQGQYPVQVAVAYVGPETYPAATGADVATAAPPAAAAAAPDAAAPDAAAEQAKQAAAAQAEQEFAKQLETARAKVKSLTQRLDGWVYLVAKSSLDKVLVDRAALLAPPAAAPDTTTGVTTEP